jgi:hypothetical protein
MVTPLPLSTNRIVPWNQLYARPFLTISPNGIANGQSSYINGGADYGPDTLLNGTGPGLTQTGGIHEFNLALPQNQALNQPNSFGGQLLQGQIEYSAQVVLSAPNLVLAGAGMDNTAIKNNGYSNSTGAAIIYSNASYPPAPGFTLRDLSFDYSGATFEYGLQIGVPGGTNPDEVSAAILLLHVANRGDTGVTGYGLVLDSIEDSLVLHCLLGGSSVSQILNNGGARILGGNYSIVNIPSKFFTVQEAVLTNVILGNDIASPSSIALIGTQFNGNVGVGAISTVSASLHCKLLAVASNINNDQVTASTGFISGAVANKVTLHADGCTFTVGGGSTYLPQPIWPAAAAGHVAGWGTIYDCTTQSETPAQLLGVGNQVTGRILDASGVTYEVRNGYVRPIGVVADPWGNFVPYNGTSTPALGPNVSSATAAPAKSTTYTVFLSDCIIISSGGSSVSITVTDGNGHTLLSGATSLSNYYLNMGSTINFGAFTAAPTTVVNFL